MDAALSWISLKDQRLIWIEEVKEKKLDDQMNTYWKKQEELEKEGKND